MRECSVCTRITSEPYYAFNETKYPVCFECWKDALVPDGLDSSLIFYVAKILFGIIFLPVYMLWLGYDYLTHRK